MSTSESAGRPRLLTLIEEARPFAERLVYQETLINTLAAVPSDCVDGFYQVMGKWRRHAVDAARIKRFEAFGVQAQEAAIDVQDAAYVLGIAVGQMLRPLPAAKEHAPSGKNVRLGNTPPRTVAQAPLTPPAASSALHQVLRRMAVELDCTPEEASETFDDHLECVHGVLIALEVLAESCNQDEALVAVRLGWMSTLIADAVYRAQMLNTAWTRHLTYTAETESAGEQ